MKKSNLLLILIILAVFAIVFTCVSCQKDEKYNWKVKTKVIIVPSELFGVNAAVTLNIPDCYQDNMTRKEMDAYEYDRTFNGFMQLGDSVSKFYFVRENLVDSGNYYVESFCHGIPVYCWK